jgi:phage shock protein A
MSRPRAQTRQSVTIQRRELQKLRGDLKACTELVGRLERRVERLSAEVDSLRVKIRS